MDLINTMKKYVAELDQTRNFLDKHCTKIQSSLHALNNRIGEEVLSTEIMDDEEKSGATQLNSISNSQMDEIDILIKKAESVLVDDSISGRKKKMKPVSDVLGKDSSQPENRDVSKRRNSSLKPVSKDSVKSNRPASAMTKRVVDLKNNIGTASRNALTSRPSNVTKQKERKLIRSSKSEKISSASSKDGLHEKRICVGDIDPRRPQVLPENVNKPRLKSLLYDSNFKEEYCDTRKLRRDLLKLQMDHSLRKENRESMGEFMASIHRRTADVAKVESIETITEMINDSMLTDNELFEILKIIKEIRSIARRILLMNCSEHNEMNLNIELPFNHNFYNMHVSCIKDIFDFIKLLQLKYSVTFQEDLKKMVEKWILTNTNSIGQTILLSRQLSMLLLGGNTYSSLVHHP